MDAVNNLDYSGRMLSYYPEVIKAIQEFKAITLTEGKEVSDVKTNLDLTLDNAYLTTMHEDRLVQWENILGIRPIEGSSLEDRRETIIARIRGQGKLNTELINTIVNTFTGGTANAWVENGVLYVEITPPRDNKQYIFKNVEQELKKKVPAHLGFQVKRNYFTWNDIANAYATWQDVSDNFNTWNDVYLFIPFEQGGV